MGDAEPLTTEFFKSFMEAQNKNITEEIKKSEESITGKISAISQTIAELQTKVVNQDAKIDEQNIKIGKQDTEIEKHSERIKILEISIRKKNLIFHNVPEPEDQHEVNLKQVVSKIIIESISLDTNENEIEFIYRLGKKTNQSSTKPRPILAGFFSYEKKQQILKEKSRFKDCRVTEDFPKEVIETRRRLAPIFGKLREEGKQVQMRIDKLVVDGKVWEEKTDENYPEDTSNKRKYEANSPQGNDQKRPAKKPPKSKTIENAPSKPETKRNYLRGNERTPVCSPITKFLSQRAVAEVTTISTPAITPGIVDLNKTLE